MDVEADTGAINSLSGDIVMAVTTLHITETN